MQTFTQKHSFGRDFKDTQAALKHNQTITGSGFTRQNQTVYIILSVEDVAATIIFKNIVLPFRVSSRLQCLAKNIYNPNFFQIL